MGPVMFKACYSTKELLLFTCAIFVCSSTLLRPIFWSIRFHHNIWCVVQ